MAAGLCLKLVKDANVAPDFKVQAARMQAQVPLWAAQDSLA